jgi:nucleotide-binding universal stress UspA family protein
MPLIEKILYPVDFSHSCVAMAPYVKRASSIFGARVSLIHVVDPASFNSFALVSRPMSEVNEDLLEIGRERLDSFLVNEFPAAQASRILASGDAATEISRVARAEGFSIIIMPTHAGRFRQMLLGSTTAKVLNDADCPVLTSTHAETIAPRPMEHREWLCAIGLGPGSEKMLRFATHAAAEARGKFTIIHAVRTADPEIPVQLDLKEQIRSAERHYAMQRIAELQGMVGSEAAVRIAVGSVKEALLEAALESDADALLIGRNPGPGVHGRMRDLTYAMVRDSPFPVLSV